MHWTVRPYRHPDVVCLVAQVQQEYRRLYSSESGDESVVAEDHFDPPAGLFLVGYRNGEPLAMGGWRTIGSHRLDATRPAELKRMYVAPSMRGQGYARAALAELERTALVAGVDLMVLESGVMQPEALSLYASAGYTPVDPQGWAHYVGNELAVHLGKLLRPPELSVRG